MILREIDINSRVIKFRASLCALSEIEKLSLIHKRKFREINSLVIRYFHEFFVKSARVNFCNFHAAVKRATEKPHSVKIP